jgi:hypothetical protein
MLSNVRSRFIKVLAANIWQTLRAKRRVESACS